jgi:hypothetical protein
VNLYGAVERGQLRRWKFVSGDNATIGGANLREGKCFLVVDVEGIRCDTVQDGGSSESFYVEWLINNSEYVR